MEFGIFHEFWSTTAQSQAEAFRNSFAQIEAAERLHEEWPDPAGLGGDVNAVMDATEKQTAVDALTWARLIAERAVALEDDGQDHAAYTEWTKLFGSRMTRP